MTNQWRLKEQFPIKPPTFPPDAKGMPGREASGQVLNAIAALAVPPLHHERAKPMSVSRRVNRRVRRAVTIEGESEA